MSWTPHTTEAALGSISKHDWGMSGLQREVQSLQERQEHECLIDEEPI